MLLHCPFGAGGFRRASRKNLAITFKGQPVIEVLPRNCRMIKRIPDGNTCRNPRCVLILLRMRPAENKIGQWHR